MASVKTTITEQGLALMDKIIIESAQLTFTGMAIGDGENLNTSTFVTDLINKRLDIAISQVYATEDGTVIRGNVENSTVVQSFEIREVGVYAKQEGSTEAPILFAYTECEGVGGIPAASIVAINNEILITISTGNANVLYVDNPTATVTRQDINDLIETQKDVVELAKEVEELTQNITNGNYVKKSEIQSGVQTQTIFGYDPITGEDTKNAMYLSGDTVKVMINGKEIAFPVEAGTLALKSDLDGKADKTHTHNVGDINATLAQYEEANNSARGSNERHGKVIFVTNNGDDGGIYIGGSMSTRITWTQWLSRLQWDKIRAYGNTNGQYEDYVLTPKEDGSNADKQIARKKDLEGKQDKLTAGENITIENGVISATGGAIEYTDSDSIQIGYGAKAGKEKDEAVDGENGDDGEQVAIGRNANGSWDGVAIGYNANGADSGVAVGRGANAPEGGGVAIGAASGAYKAEGVAVGNGAKSLLDGSISIGYSTSNPVPYGVAIGYNVDVIDESPIVIGSNVDGYDCSKAQIKVSKEGVMTVGGETVAMAKDLEGLGGGESVTVDAALSDTSENPVQNKVVKVALDSRLVMQSTSSYSDGNAIGRTHVITCPDKRDGLSVKVEKNNIITLISRGTTASYDITKTLPDTSVTDALASRLDTLERSGTGGSADITIDDSLSLDSTNPVQNKIVTKAINDLDTEVGACVKKTATINMSVGKSVSIESEKSGASVLGSFNGYYYDEDADVEHMVDIQPHQITAVKDTSEGEHFEEVYEWTGGGENQIARKKDLEGLGGSSVTVDTELSATSTNPIQNAYLGKRLGATSSNSVQIGDGAKAGKTSGQAIDGSGGDNGYQVAVGRNANGSNCGVAVGAIADGSNHGVAIGQGADGSNFCVAIGYYADASDDTPIVIGADTSDEDVDYSKAVIKVSKDGVMTIGGKSVAMASDVAHGINPTGAVSHTATQTYDETSGYTYAKDVTATANGYISCQATQTYESEAANKIILTCSINGTVIHKDCASCYGDMASILIPVAKGQTVNVQATSTEPATVEIKFMPLNS